VAVGQRRAVKGGDLVVAKARLQDGCLQLVVADLQ